MHNKFKVIQKTENQQSGENVIERLKEALAMAEDGYIKNVAIVAVMNDDDVMDCWANKSGVYTLIGGIDGLKMEFMHSCIETREG